MAAVMLFVYTPTGTGGIVSAIITLLIATIFIFFAAKFVLGRSSFISAFLVALLGTLLASLAVLGVTALGAPGWVGLVTAIVVWALVAAIFFRAAWVQGAIIGLVAWVLFALVSFLVELILG